MIAVSTVLGSLAVATTVPVQPTQARHVIRNRNNSDVLSGVSPTTLLIVGLCSSLWFVYGLQYAFASAVTAITDIICISIIITVLVRYGLVRAHNTAAGAGLVVLLAVLSVFLPAPVLGACGAAVSSAMHFPQAVRIVRSIGTPAVIGFSPITLGFMTLANSIWIAYGVSLDNTWIVIPSAMHLVSVAMMVVAQIVSKRKSPDQTAVAEL